MAEYLIRIHIYIYLAHRPAEPHLNLIGRCKAGGRQSVSIIVSFAIINGAQNPLERTSLFAANHRVEGETDNASNQQYGSRLAQF